MPTPDAPGTKAFDGRAGGAGGAAGGDANGLGVRPDRAGQATERTRRRAAIVEEERMVAEMLVLALGRQGFDCRIVTPDDGQAVLAEVRRLQPDVTVVDLDLGSQLRGLSLVGALAATTNVLVLGGSRQPDRFAEVVALGALGWVSKGAPLRDLLRAASAAADGQRLYRPEEYAALADTGRRRLAQWQMTTQRLDRLTKREHEVLGHLARGGTVAEIASAMGVSVLTVRTHIRGILAKLEVSSQLAAVAVAAQAGRLMPGH